MSTRHFNQGPVHGGSPGAGGEARAPTPFFQNIGNGPGARVILASTLTPLLVPLVYLLWHEWQHFVGEQWTAWPKAFIALAMLAAFLYVLMLFYEFVPALLSSLLTAFYMAIMYGLVVDYLQASDLWRIMTGIVAGVAGYYIGGMLANLDSRHGEHAKWIMEACLLPAGMAILLFGRGPMVAEAAPSWLVHALPALGGMLVLVGLFAMIGRFPWLALVAVGAGLVVWVEDPGIMSQLYWHLALP